VEERLGQHSTRSTASGEMMLGSARVVIDAAQRQAVAVDEHERAVARAGARPWMVGAYVPDASALPKPPWDALPKARDAGTELRICCMVCAPVSAICRGRP